MSEGWLRGAVLAVRSLVGGNSKVLTIKTNEK